MLVVSISCILIFYLYMIKKQRALLNLIPLSSKGVLNLYRSVTLKNKNLSLKRFYFFTTLMFIAVIVMGYLLKLNYLYLVTITIILLIVSPLIITWTINYHKNLFQFNNLIQYLSHFIILFKNHPKVYNVLSDVYPLIEGDLQSLIKESLDLLDLGTNNLKALNVITNQYPHFIVYNLHLLANSVEVYGSKDFTLGLDLILDDIDDLNEDISNFNYLKLKTINKIFVLIGFAFIICFVSLKMLFAIDVEVNNFYYQTSMLIFCLIQIITLLLAFSLYNVNFLESSEMIC